MAFLLPVVFSPSVHATFWSPAAALCVVVAAVGLPRLAALWRGPSRPIAGLALAFGLVAVLGVVLSRQPLLATVGLYGWGTGLVFTLALVGAWAVGRSLDERGARLVADALLAAVVVNATVAVLQTVMDLSTFSVGLYDGRAHGLLGNPVHLGGFAAAGIALAAPRLRSSRRWLVVVALAAAAVQLSGSRAGVALTVGVVVVALVRSRTLGVWLAVGVVAGAALAAGADGLGGGVNVSATSRAQGSLGGGGATARLEMWAIAADAVTERPLIGHGTGLFRVATSDARTLEMAHAEGPDILFTDAHNIVVEYATTTGIVGVALFLGWLGFATRSGHGPLLWFAAVLLASHLVEPQWVRTTPVALLALGAAAAGGTAIPRRRAASIATVPLAAGAVVVAGVLLVGDFHLDQARLDFVERHARDAVTLLRPWPEPATVMARIRLFEERTLRRPELAEDAVRWRRRAVERDPTNPALWSALGEDQLANGDPGAAQRSFRAALRHDPVSARALTGLGLSYLGEDDERRARAAFARSLRVKPDQPRLRALLRRP